MSILSILLDCVVALFLYFVFCLALTGGTDFPVLLAMIVIPIAIFDAIFGTNYADLKPKEKQ